MESDRLGLDEERMSSMSPKSAANAPKESHQLGLRIGMRCK